MESKYLIKYESMTIDELLDRDSIIMGFENNTDILYYAIACKEKARKEGEKEDKLLSIVDYELNGLYNIGFLKNGHFRILANHGIFATVLRDGRFYIPEISWC